VVGASLEDIVVEGSCGGEMLKVVAAIVGALLLLGGVGVGIAHYVLESSDTMKFITLAIAAALLVLGWALLDWGAGVSRRWGGRKSKDDGSG
jgi:heme/copper-type cytochrome/quinol oxidase subunit 3